MSINEEIINDIREISEAEMETITGGVAVNTGIDRNAGVWKAFDHIATKPADYSLPNGTDVAILGAPQYHSGKGRNYVKIQFTHKGKTCTGWIAASIVGLKR